MSVNKTLRLFLFVCFIFLPLTVFSQDEDLFPGGEYDESIPTPLEIIGHRLGELPNFHWELENYLRAVEQTSDRIEVRSYGKTYQGRNLYYIIISTPENLRRLEEIRTSNLKLTDPRTTNRYQAEKIAEWMPSIVWIGCNIHGNEISGSEAAIRTIYQLTAGNDRITGNILKNVVCIIDPDQNPDGHDRYVHSVRSVVTDKSHPQTDDMEHSSPWPGGRGNHYLFDLNRDFFLKTQIESLQKAKVYHEWMPHVFPDLHEMGSNSTYFFAPPMSPYNEYVTPELKKWWNIIAHANAKAFDRFGWGYYTRESFDAFYPGYGVSYPSINGAIGMTYEEASANGVSIKRDDGTILSLRESAWHQFTTSMATLNVIAENREERIKDFYNFFVTALEEADTDPLKEIILVPDKDPFITVKLIDNILLENIEIKKATESFTNKEATSYMTKKTGVETFPAGSYIINVKQPQKRVIKALLAPESSLSDEFIEEEKERKKNREGSHFYDVTAWSMPLTYGIDAYWTGKNSYVQTQPVTKAPEFQGKVTGGEAQQAYLIPYNTIAGTRILVRLLSENYNVRMARKSFTLNGTTWPVGTLVVRVNRNPDCIHKRIRELAEECTIEIAAVHTGLSDGGIDLGSNNIVTIDKPEIALLAESPVSGYSYGALHYLFEREFDIPFTRLNPRNLADLKDYNVVVMPGGRYNGFLSKNQIESFRNWIRDGGTVVAVPGAVEWLRSEEAKISNVKLLSEQPDPEDKTKKISHERTPGAICKVTISRRSFLSYGVSQSVAVFVRTSDIYMPFEDNEFKNVGLFAPAEELKLSGFIWPETEKHLAEKGYLFVEPFGRGKLILFAEDPNFRASYDGLNKLFFNAVLLGPSFSVSGRRFY